MNGNLPSNELIPFRSSFDVTQSTKLERSLANGVDDINDESKV